MVMKRVGYFFLVFLLASISACKHEFPVVPAPQIGGLENADLSAPIFIGSSAFAGVMNGALSEPGMENSIPSMFMRVLDMNDENVHPAINSANGFNIFENQTLTGNQGAYRLFYPALDTVGFLRETKPGDALQYENVDSDQLRNYAFPKTQLLDLTERNRTQNPFIGQFFTNQNISVLDRIVSQEASFFVLDLGEELFGFALNGAEGSDNSTDVLLSTYSDLIDENLFQQKLDELTDVLLALDPNVKGAILNIPDFLKYPYFRKTRFDITPFILGTDFFLGKPISSDSPWRTAAPIASQYNRDLIEYYRQNPTIPSDQRRPFLDFGGDIKGNWGILVEDDDLAEVVLNGNVIPKVRHVTRDETMFYFHEFLLGGLHGFLPTTAIPENQYLKQREIDLIRSKITTFNQIIDGVVQNSGGRLVKVDLNSFFEKMFVGTNNFFGSKGIGVRVDGVLLEPHISEFGIFSADGLFLNPAGNALITNEIIKAVNNQFGGDLKLLDPNSFPGTAFEGIK